MSYLYKSNDGLMGSNDKYFIDIWNRASADMANAKAEWISDLRAKGVKAAHPDDGWVNREENEAVLCYPQFNDGLDVGDTLALGCPDGETRLVRITYVRQGNFGTVYYGFGKVRAAV